MSIFDKPKEMDEPRFTEYNSSKISTGMMILITAAIVLVICIIIATVLIFVGQDMCLSSVELGLD